MKVYRHLAFALTGLVAVTAFGTIGFILFEKLEFFDSLWLTLITVLTVGYGDVIPRTYEGKMFAMIIIPLGVVNVTYFIGALTSMMIEGEFSKALGRKRMEKKIAALEKHIIVCGLGRVGDQVVSQLQSRGIPAVVVDKTEEILTEKLPQGTLFLHGDATEDNVLLKAGIEKASGLIATLPEDADNVFIALTAKGLNPKIHIVARAEKLQSEEKLRRAGADKVINPSSIGGKQLVMSILKPISVEYVDMMLQAGKMEFGVEEISVSETSPLNGKTIAFSQIRSQYGVTIVAILRHGELISNPKPDERILAGDIVIVFGSNEQLGSFEKATTAV